MTTYSRKAYEATAKILKEADKAIILEADRINPGQLHDQIVDSFIELFEADNPRFDRDRFVDACLMPARFLDTLGEE